MDNDWNTLRAELPDDARARLDLKRQARRLGRELAEARKSLSMTQGDVARRAEMTQNTISKIENADDVLLSTVLRYMRAMGGSLEFVLKTPDGGTRHVLLDP